MQQAKSFLVPRGHSQVVYCVAFSPDGKRLATGESLDNTVRFWDASTGQPLGTVNDLTLVKAISFSPTGRRIISGGMTGRFVWDVSTGRELRHLTGHIQMVTGSMLQSRLSLGCIRKSRRIVRVYVSTGRGLFPQGAHRNCNKRVLQPKRPVHCFRSSDNTVKLWDLRPARDQRDDARHRGLVSQAVFSLDGRWIASAGYDRTVRVRMPRPGRNCCL